MRIPDAAGPAVSLIYERMTTVNMMGYTIKVWETVPAFDFGPNHEITVALRGAINGEPGSLCVTAEGMANVLDSLPNISNYQITDGSGHGVEVFRI